MSYSKEGGPQVQVAVQALFYGAAPERESELKDFWDLLQLQFSLLPDEQAPVMEGGAYRYVHFNHRALRIFWVSAFAAWEAYRESTRALIEGIPKDLTRLRRLLQIALEVRDAEDPESVSLDGLPQPGYFPDPLSEPESRSAAELAVIATAWAMLHEVSHLQRQQTGTSSQPEDGPSAAQSEELGCDNFAADFLMRDVERYASNAAVSADAVRMKRSIGIYFAAFALTVMSSPTWGESASHPSIQARLDAIRNILSGQRIDEALCIGGLAFASLREVWPNAPFIGASTESGSEPLGGADG